jgi:hypothetical protein
MAEFETEAQLYKIRLGNLVCLKATKPTDYRLVSKDLETKSNGSLWIQI